MFDLAYIIIGGSLIVIVVAYGATKARDGAARHHTGKARSYDGGRLEVVKLKRHQTSLAYAEPEPEPAQLVPYLPPDPAPVIRVNLPQAAPEPTWSAERRTLNRTPAVATDFGIPALQASFTALCCTTMAGLLSWALDWSWRVPVAVLALSLGGAWLWRLRFADNLLWTIETLTRHDLTGDDQVGAPQPAPAYTLANPCAARSEVAAETRQAAKDSERADLLVFLDTCFLKGTSESAQGIAAGDRADYLKRRDALLALGIAAWKNPTRPKAGWRIAVSRERARQIITKHVL